MSLLLSEGHTRARIYPVWMAWSEARIVRARIVDRISTEAVVMQSVIASVLAGGNSLRDTLKDLREDGD